MQQVLGHCIDNERVFGHRAARFAANDETPQPGYDQDAAVAAFDYTGVSLPDLLAEFTALRRSHDLFFARLSPRQWSATGLADGRPMSVRAVAYLQVGHLRHHVAILRERIETS